MSVVNELTEDQKLEAVANVIDKWLESLSVVEQVALEEDLGRVTTKEDFAALFALVMVEVSEFSKASR